MYRLTPRMLQRFKRDLEKYHDLFTAGRCSGWEQEELIVGAIKSDTAANHHVVWREAGHDSEADITVTKRGRTYPIQIKSGQIDSQDRLVLSGYRMGKYAGDWPAITNYLKSKQANILAVPYKQVDDGKGRRHIYRVSYISATILHDISATAWRRIGKQHRQTSRRGVEFSVRPSQSWQIWWAIPLSYVTDEVPFEIS